MPLDLGERTFDDAVSKGVPHYFWREGVIGWGVPVGVYVFVVTGVIYGLIMWRFVLRSGEIGE